ncbi:MAG: cobalt ECF transporter T component CbiQ [Syntrophomonadaceae bacterium]|nr:cobalt ECF transporter T component CbiQ [Syntrophomonadaceae bacterium]
MLPTWMTEEFNTVGCETGKKVRRRRRNGFLSRSLHHLRKAICDQVETERYASRDGLWQKLNPGVKLGSVLVLILLAGLTRSIVVLLFLWGLTAVLMALSRLPVISLQKRIWSFIPLVTLVVALPGMFNLLLDGTPLVMLYQSSTPVVWMGLKLPDSIYITRQGAGAALFLCLRVGISLSAGVLLVATTQTALLLRSLQVLRVPQLFVMLLEMSYRYLALLLRTSIEMFEARSLRTVGKMSLRKKQALVGSALGALFIKSMTLSEEVYLAMTARGYTGEAVTGGKMAIRRLDVAWILMIVMISFTVAAGGIVLT